MGRLEANVPLRSRGHEAADGVGRSRGLRRGGAMLAPSAAPCRAWKHARAGAPGSPNSTISPPLRPGYGSALRSPSLRDLSPQARAAAGLVNGVFHYPGFPTWSAGSTAVELSVSAAPPLLNREV